MADLRQAAQQAVEQQEQPNLLGWSFRRNGDGSIGIKSPPPKPGESQRTGESVYPTDGGGLHELLSKFVDHLDAPKEKPRNVEEIAADFGREFAQTFSGKRTKPQPEQEPVVPPELEAHFRHLDAVLEQQEKQQAEQEQEPVEIKPPNPEGATQCIVRWCAETPAGWVGAWDREALEQFVHPPRRSWQGLSEEEIEDLRDDRYFRFARAVEQALKEKNNG